MFQRVSAVDGNSYAIGFEMRLPNAWNGRFFYQANGGIDGSVVTATGAVNGGGGADQRAGSMGFAVISSDAGHAGAQGPFFGIDPQARLDYGYQAVGKLTPMAKSAIQHRLRQGPRPLVLRRLLERRPPHDGRRGALCRPVRRLPGRRPGLPPAAGRDRQHRRRARRYATRRHRPGRPRRPASPPPSARWSRTPCSPSATRSTAPPTAWCRTPSACQAAFNLARDVPTCAGARDGTCLSAAQKTVIAQRLRRRDHQHRHAGLRELPVRHRPRQRRHRVLEVHRAAGARLRRRRLHLAGAAGEPGHLQRPGLRARPATSTRCSRKIQATNATYTEIGAVVHDAAATRATSSTLKNRGAKMMVYHGTSDPIFSSDDTTAWYEALRAANGGDAAQLRALLPRAGHEPLLAAARRPTSSTC